MNNGQANVSKAGFLTFPGHELRPDPSAPAGPMFYDRGSSKWLPVPRTSVSPDGKRYAYTEGNAYQNTGGKVHVVDVATGADKVIYSGSPVFGVVDFAAEGIYLSGAPPEGYARGLWLENPSGGTPRLINSTIVAPAVGGGAAWGLIFNPADPSPGPGGIEGPRNEILHVDLRSGAATHVFYLPGSSLYVLGFDRHGSAFVGAVLDTGVKSTWEVWLVASPKTATRLYTGSGIQLPMRPAAIDGNGVWFDDQYASASGSTLWLYTGGSIHLVATVNLGNLADAGGCIP